MSSIHPINHEGESTHRHHRFNQLHMHGRLSSRLAREFIHSVLSHALNKFTPRLLLLLLLLHRSGVTDGSVEKR
jgi:hypothetical protein